MGHILLALPKSFYSLYSVSGFTLKNTHKLRCNGQGVFEWRDCIHDLEAKNSIENVYLGIYLSQSRITKSITFAYKYFIKQNKNKNYIL